MGGGVRWWWGVIVNLYDKLRCVCGGGAMVILCAPCASHYTERLMA